MSYFALGLTPFFPHYDRAGQYLSALHFKHDLDVNEVSKWVEEMVMAFIKVIRCAERLVSDASTTANHRYAEPRKERSG